ncbi:hypothetical protein BDR26DRAFT_868042 [Obelidium mucronatum]|nr:hypothetical protein BDR26DRAFT_868042 [Obelidium mucronatum]
MKLAILWSLFAIALAQTTTSDIATTTTSTSVESGGSSSGSSNPLEQTAVEQTAVEMVQSIFSELPPCGKTCFAKLPGYATPVGISLLKSLCSAQDSGLKQLKSCITQPTATGGCGESDLAPVNSVLDMIPTGCSLLGPDVLANAAAAAAASASGTATAGDGTTEPKGNDAVGLAAGLGFVVAATVVLGL